MSRTLPTTIEPPNRFPTLKGNASVLRPAEPKAAGVSSRRRFEP